MLSDHSRFSVPAFLLLALAIFLTGFSGSARADNGGKKSLNARIQIAIERGVEFLKNKQNPDGSWDEMWTSRHPGGETALALLALLESGVDRKDPVIQKGIGYLIQLPFKKTYEVAISIMAVESAFTPDRERREVAQWMTGNSSDFDLGKRELSPRAKRWMLRASSWLLNQMKAEGAWTYDRNPSGRIRKQPITGNRGFVGLEKVGRATDSGERWDHSNSQYGVLGLHSASRCGIVIHRKHWRQILIHWLKQQMPEGPRVDLTLNEFDGEGSRTAAGKTKNPIRARGWWYVDRNNDSNHKNLAMTAGGIGSIAIARYHLEKQGGLSGRIQDRIDQAIYDGLGWIKKNYHDYPADEDLLYGHAGFNDYYLLYAIERAMMLTRTKKLDGHDWYIEGARSLVNSQQDDGSWRGDPPDSYEGDQLKSKNVESSFALLFLKRATLPVSSKR